MSRAWRIALAISLGVALVHGVAWARWGLSSIAAARGSISHGLTAAGGLSFGISLAPVGPDHRSISVAEAALGRQYVRADVARTLMAAFAAERKTTLNRDGAAPRWAVAETGWRAGGWFPPHLTHQDGLSVDLVTPVVADRLPRWPWQQLGYGLELSEEGTHGAQRVDFARLARLFDALCRQAPKHELVARGFIVWAPWQPSIRGRMRSGCRESLIDAPLPHDDHVHVFFTPRGRR